MLSRPGAVLGACPAADVLAAFASGDLVEHEIRALEPHLDACSSCFGLVGNLGRSTSRAADLAAELAPGSAVARYQILSLVGRGAFGAVYAAYDPELDRKIALKLVRHRRAEDEERFLREARAMASVSSPHVIAVHDVGRIDAGLFIAMEFVDGQTLGAWLAEERRTPREIVAAFVQAGRGLAAAHAEGIVHRDFKPDNVLVHRTGRVAVTDFGLAWTPRTELAGDELPGALIGTPMFMAPEALRREPVDARSDLFSFCVALYAALYGVHPFPAATLSELEAAFTREPRPPHDAAVPRHVRDAVLAGLRLDPVERPPTLLTLVRALEHDPRRKRIALAIAAASAVAIVSVVASVVSASSTAPPAPDCRARARALADDTWGTAPRAAVRAAISASPSPLAHDAVGRVESALDRYAGAWQRGWIDACEANEAGRLLPVIADRRFACLDHRRAQWGSLVTALEHPDETAVLGASSAAYALPGVELCTDPRWLATRASPADEARLTTAYAAIARAQVLSDLGSTAAGLRVLEAPLAEARASGDRSLEAAARLVEGDLRRAVDPRAAEAPLHASAIAASAVGRLDLEARAKVLLVQTLAHSQIRIADATRAVEYAQAAVIRLGDPSLVVEYLYARSLVEWSTGGAEQSLPLERLTLLTAIVVHGPEHPKVAEALNSIAVSFLETDRIPASLVLQRAALAMRERLQGPSHPEALNARGNLALALAENGEVDEALVLQEAVAVDRARVLGSDYFLLDETWLRLADLYQREVGRWDDALRAARRARAVDEREYGPEGAEGIASLSAVARILAAQSVDLAAADAASIKAMQIAEANLPATHPLVRVTLVTRAFVLERSGRCPEAMPLHARIDAVRTSPRIGASDRVASQLSRARCYIAAGDVERASSALNSALELREQSRGSASPMLAEVLLELARLERARGNLARAEATARRAIAVRAAVPSEALASARFELAQILVTSDPRAARTEAELANAWLRDRPTLPLARAVATWRAEHP